MGLSRFSALTASIPGLIWVGGCARAQRGVADEHTQKRCSTCKEWKLLQHFTPDPGKTYDRSSDCKPCAAKRQAGRRPRKKANA